MGEQLYGPALSTPGFQQQPPWRAFLALLVQIKEKLAKILKSCQQVFVLTVQVMMQLDLLSLKK